MFRFQMNCYWEQEDQQVLTGGTGVEIEPPPINAPPVKLNPVPVIPDALDC